MTVSTLHYLSPVVIGTTNLGGITATDNPLSNEIRDEPSSGELTARIQALVAQGIQPTFSTQDIGNALALCGSLGISLASRPLKIYAQAGSDDGRRASAGHYQFTYSKGLLLPQSLDGNHQGDCSLSYMALVCWDGTNNPVVVSQVTNIPTITSDSRWTLSSATIAGLAIPQLKSVRIQFGIKAEAEGADSDVWASHPSISAIQPVISITSSKISGDILPLIGSTGTFSIEFRKRLSGGTFGTNTLTLSGSGMGNITKYFGASGNKAGEATFECRPMYDGTNDPIIITAA
jgi:hypothetical protein